MRIKNKLFVSVLVLFIILIVVSPQANSETCQPAEEDTEIIDYIEPVEATQIKEKITNSEVKTTKLERKPYSDEDLDLLSRLIYAEAGCEWISDRHQQLVGMVAMNRVKSNLFPNTLKEVIYQEGQYSCTWEGSFDRKPSTRAIQNAKKVLLGETGIDCPSDVVFQAAFKQGNGVFEQIYDRILGTTTYFCYA